MPESTTDTTTVSTGKSRQDKALVKASPSAADSSSSAFYDTPALDDTQETEDAQKEKSERERKRQYQWKYLLALVSLILKISKRFTTPKHSFASSIVKAIKIKSFSWYRRPFRFRISESQS